MQRLDRLTALLLQLQGRPLVRAQQLAERFGISLRTVYRDVRALQAAGVPIVGEAGSGYRLLEGYKLPPVHFDRQEAMALLAAARLVEAQGDAALAQHYERALDKVRAVLRYGEKDLLDGLDKQVAVRRPRTFQTPPGSERHLPLLLEAVGTGTVLELTYRSAKEEALRREVEPVGVYFLAPAWYLVGWCRLRGAYRHFRSDRMEAVRSTGETSTRQHPPLARLLEQLADERPLQAVCIEARPGVIDSFGQQKYYQGFVQQEALPDRDRAQFLSPSLEGMARWLLLFGEDVLHVEPASLTVEVMRIAKAVQRRMQQLDAGK